MIHRYTRRIVHSLSPASVLFFLLLQAAPAWGQGNTDWPAATSVTMPSGGQLAQLRAGDVLAEDLQEVEAGGAARVQALFRAPARVIWDAIASCENNFVYIAGLRECEVLQLEATYSRTRQVVKKGWYAPSMEFTFEANRRPYENVVFRLVDGDLKKLRGSWVFTPVDGGDLTLVTHQIELQPAMPSPRWLVRRTLRNDLPEMLACLRWLAGASLAPEQVDGDAAQCPDRQRAR